jgi:hypothetical protein
VFGGTSSQGLTAAQVGQVTFVDPVGWPAGNYPAQILSTGELIPAVPPPRALMRNPDALILSWTGDYQLLSATNVGGPYVPIPERQIHSPTRSSARNVSFGSDCPRLDARRLREAVMVEAVGGHHGGDKCGKEAQFLQVSRGIELMPISRL